ncbi:MAG: Maf family protein [Ilumatobacter sp.]|uniref:Maf family protein n=1 Tax=Ilumatobacter sp. TaxID=1967498 RepID=UPI003C743FBA
MIELPADRSLVLASGSPRRRELLTGAGLAFAVRAADIDETPLSDEAPTAYVRRLSIEKAAASAGSPLASTGDVIIAADTTVEANGLILEKPLDDDDAYGMLRRLSGRSHQVHTGVTVSVARDGARRSSTILVTTEVSFVPLTDEMIDWYLTTGEADDKAGAYGIQGAAAAFVERVDGSVTNVIGLPLAETLSLLRDALAALDV